MDFDSFLKGYSKNYKQTKNRREISKLILFLKNCFSVTSRMTIFGSFGSTITSQLNKRRESWFTLFHTMEGRQGTPILVDYF